MMIVATCCYGNDTTDGTIVLIQYGVFAVNHPNWCNCFCVCVCVKCMIFVQIVPNMV